MPDLDRAAFADWLRAQPPDAVVGERDDCDECPIARWLTDRWDLPVEVATDLYTTAAEGSWLDLPAWAQQFVGRIDAGGSDGPITAAEALAVLAEVPE